MVAIAPLIKALSFEHKRTSLLILKSGISCEMLSFQIFSIVTVQSLRYVCVQQGVGFFKKICEGLLELTSKTDVGINGVHFDTNIAEVHLYSFLQIFLWGADEIRKTTIHSAIFLTLCTSYCLECSQPLLSLLSQFAKVWMNL